MCSSDLTLFLPATYGKHMVNGHSNHEKAREEILRRRDELARLDDKSQLNAYIKNNPLSIEEIFEFGAGGQFDEDTIESINHQLRELPKIKDKPVPHKIIVTGTHVQADPASESPIEILEHPKDGVDYIVGIDGIGTSDLTSSNSGNSKYAVVVTKGLDPVSELQFAPIASYLERPRTIEKAHQQAIKLIKHYNQYGRCKVMAELNQGTEALLTMMINEGLSSTVMMRKDLNKKGWVDLKKPWFYRAEQILKWQIEAANTYFKKYSHMVLFKDLLIDATKGINENTDLLDAFEAALYGWGSGDIFTHRVREKVVRKVKFLRYEMQNGVMQPVWYEKDISV